MSFAFITAFHFHVNIYLHSQPTKNHACELSSDGYIRLSLTSLSKLSFVHLFSTHDDAFLAELRAQDVPACSAGFTEWKSDAEPAVSLGWGWFIHDDSDQIMLAPDGVRSNVMLLDTYGYDLGARRTSDLFCTWLQVFPWQDVLSMILNQKYSC